jgi:hypothetical protein
MENDIFIYTSGYLAARLAILIGFGYALYHVMRPRRVTVRSAAGSYQRDARRADAVFDDQC